MAEEHSVLGAVKRYYSLTKPGVTYGNVISGGAGFLFAAAHFRHFDPLVFTMLIVGMTCVIGAACALNNVLDQDIDKLMDRTKKRAVAAGMTRPKRAAVFAVMLGLVGTGLLAYFVSLLVAVIGVVGFVVYVWLYGALAKRRSVHGTLVGSISGALPILAGYAAVAGGIDVGGIITFLLLFCWQFPEFYSIAIYRRGEYAAAHVPVMTVIKGVEITKRQIVAYTVLFVALALLLVPLGYAGYVYLVVMGVSGMYFAWLAFAGLHAADNDKWARQMFHTSLKMLLLLCVMLPLGALLP
jgi:protoheme IX farnesyltransferase